MVVLISSILWANMVLKRRGAMLSKVKPNLTFEAQMELLRSSSINSSQQLFPPDLITTAGEKSNRALHDEVLRKVVTFKKCEPKVSNPSKPQPRGQASCILQ